MKRAYIAFGANLSNPRQALMDSVAGLGEAGVLVDAVSNLWRSQAWPPGSGAPDYENAAMSVRTELTASDLMALLLWIETDLGRVRTVRNAPRTCDLDLLDYDGQHSEDAFCTLPHPRLHQRDFVLLPLAEIIDPDWRHPILGTTTKEMLETLSTKPET